MAANSGINPFIVLARKDICAVCPHKCSGYLAGTIAFEDASASCPVEWRSRWRATGSDKIKPVDQMNYRELQEHGRKLLAECGGCNRRKDATEQEENRVVLPFD